MSLLPIVPLIVWAGASFLVHNLIHEGAHALVAVLGRANPVKLWPFPGRRLGYFTWAYMSYTGPLSASAARWIDVAPVIAETVWLVAFLALSFFVGGWWRFFVTLEMLYALIDMTTWVLGWWTKRPHTDAEGLRRLFGWSTAKARALSFLLLVPMALAILAVVLMFA